MLTITNTTITTFEDAARAETQHRFVAALHSTFPTETKQSSELELYSLAAKAILKANDYDFTREHTAWLLCASMFRFGEQFDRDANHPWAAEILADPSLDEESIAKLLGLRLYYSHLGLV